MTTDETRHYWDIPETLVTGAWAEKRRLSSALRELVALCVTSDAPEADLRGARAAVEAALEGLKPHPQRTYQQGFPECRSMDDLAVFTDRATLVGGCNPFAPPLKLRLEGEVAVASVVFGPAFEGAPGFVHGGMVAAAFDHLFGYLLVRRSTPGLTRSLTVHYEKPTPFQTELRMEARYDRAEGRRHYLVARSFAGTEVTAKAEATFVELEASAFRKLFEKMGKAPA
jgi:acyl-coenzyme A thioesterase PaaI-like protein